MKSVIIDTDMGPDDWVAILYMLQRKDIEVKAITIAGTGEMHGLQGAKNCLRLLSLAKRRKIPVAFGRSKPIAGNNHFPNLMRWVMDRRMFLSLPKASEKPQQISACDLIEKTVHELTEKITILAIGPLTNLAEIFSSKPHIIEKIEHIYVMGGAIDVPGNIKEIVKKSKNNYAEWNTFCDPKAANMVFATGIPVTLIPLDATDILSVNRAFVDKLQVDSSNLVGVFCYKVINRLASRVEEEKYYLWDVIAAVVIENADITEIEQRRIFVVEAEGNEMGRMLDDEERGHKINVCKKVDRSQFEIRFLETIKNF
jgi:pyrimidine-specific ribonucleoside hydrolase